MINYIDLIFNKGINITELSQEQAHEALAQCCAGIRTLGNPTFFADYMKMQNERDKAIEDVNWYKFASNSKYCKPDEFDILPTYQDIVTQVANLTVEVDELKRWKEEHINEIGRSNSTPAGGAEELYYF